MMCKSWKWKNWVIYFMQVLIQESCYSCINITVGLKAENMWDRDAS